MPTRLVAARVWARMTALLEGSAAQHRLSEKAVIVTEKPSSADRPESGSGGLSSPCRRYTIAKAHRAFVHRPSLNVSQCPRSSFSIFPRPALTSAQEVTQHLPIPAQRLPDDPHRHLDLALNFAQDIIIRLLAQECIDFGV